VWLEGLGKLKNIDLIGTRTRDLLACSIVPQPTALPRAPIATTYPIYLVYNVRTHTKSSKHGTALTVPFRVMFGGELRRPEMALQKSAGCFV
jgi:hypothetical protein